jgi:hypothetical protein
LLPVFTPPRILWDQPESEFVYLTKIAAHAEEKSIPGARLDEQSGEFQSFRPDIFCRFIAKIAHGAAVAELGLDAFDPLLPDIIAGRSKYFSHLVGSTIKRGTYRTSLHEISLFLQRGYVVASVQLFAKFGFRPYAAVVGRASRALLKWHTSELIECSTAAR